MQIVIKQNLEKLLKLNLNNAEYCYISWIIKYTAHFIVSCRSLNIMSDTKLKITWQFSELCLKMCKKEHLIEFISIYSTLRILQPIIKTIAKL